MTLFQWIFVSPNVLDKEKTYIEYHIQNTRDAYNLNIEEIQIENAGTIERQEVENYTNVINNIPIAVSYTHLYYISRLIRKMCAKCKRRWY